MHVKQLRGSLDSLLIALVAQVAERTQVIVCNDREEASYIIQDIQQLLGDKEALFFPTSYKNPYQFLEVENANILERAEVLNTVSSNKDHPHLIVTYPEALNEKVINQRSLLANTWTARKGDELDIDFLAELLTSYDFERTDFVYEAGQFAVRGGIVDIFSFANELPYRLELFGDEIESIRTFDPINQLSVEKLEQIAIIPNVQTRLLHEVRESFLRFIPQNSLVWLKDVELLHDVLEQSFEKAAASFDEILAMSQGTQVISIPSDLYVTASQFQEELKQFGSIEFGNRFSMKAEKTIAFDASPQPSFNKDFNLLVSDMQELQQKGFEAFIMAESPRQVERLKNIFREIDPHLNVHEVNVALREGFIDKQLQIACYTDHQLFERYHRGYKKKKYSKTKSLTLKELRTLQPGDFVTHIDYGIGRFAGMEKIDVGGREQEAVRLIYRDDDLLYVSVHSLHKISKHSGQEGAIPQISKLGSPEWEQKKSRVRKKVKDIAHELIQLYAKRKSAPGHAYPTDGYLQQELESSFIYEDTPDQAKATQDLKEDMEAAHPMDRLVCGDVGFGKTEVAIRAAFKAVADNKQVAVLVPTTILALQHYKTFSERLKHFPVNVEYINRFRSAATVKKVLKQVEEGTVDILIGTHKLTGKDVKFNDLGLLIIDEEQKFGVKTKEKLKEMRVNVDSLTLTATPIPRTLHFSLMGARDLSVIATPPPNRQPVTTKLVTFSSAIIRDAIFHELKRGGQVFFVHNRVKDIEEVANSIMTLVPDARVTYAHGQMEGKRLERIMSEFIDHEYDVLVSTNIIESGLDIPNANTIIINMAHMFGLSDLHQMRGRVGRSNKKAFCYLVTPPLIGLPADARKRLSALEEFSDLGDGFKVAMRDLDIRGAGNLLGGEQSGFIQDLGFDMYNKILEDAVQELKEVSFRELFSKELTDKENRPYLTDCSIETDLELLIPESYVNSISERLNLYMAADKLKDEKAMEKYRQQLTDRFGPLPAQVKDLLDSVKMRWTAQRLGIEKIILKNGTFKAYLPEQKEQRYYDSPAFGKVLDFVQKFQQRTKLKDTKKRLILIVEEIGSIPAARKLVETIGGNIEEKEL
jgi:transcription-repair coupling factor (superfamily II helicase)